MLMRTLRSKMRWIMIAIAVLFVISIFGMYGFEGARKGRSPDHGEGGGDYVVVEIDGKPLMRSALDQSVRNMVSRMDVRDIKPEDIPRLYQATLDSIVTNQRLASEAGGSGLGATDAEIDHAVQEVSEQFPTKEAFMQYLDQSGVKMAEFRESIAEQIVQGKVVERASEGIEATDEEALDFYEKTKGLFFHSPAGFKVDYARFSDEKTAVRVVEELKLGDELKEAMESVASSDVISSTVDSGPVFMSEHSFKDELASFATLDTGAVGGPVLIASDDYFVGVKREIVPESTVPFDEVSGDVKSIIVEEKRREALESFFRDMRGRANVVVHDPELFHVPEVPAEVEEAAEVGESSDIEPSVTPEEVAGANPVAPEGGKEEE